MRFSIIIPAHNSANYIKKTLTSINNQCFKDYETIVVCDACEDNTEEIAMDFGAIAFPVNYHTDGLSRNAGLDIAQGEWILFLDSDDWYLHEYCFQQLSDKLDDLENIDILCYSIIWKHIGYVPCRSPKGTLYPHVTNKIWRTEFIGDTRFPDKKVANDEAFHLLMLDKKPNIYEWDMPIYYYNYLRDGSKSVELGRTADKTRQYWSNH